MNHPATDQLSIFDDAGRGMNVSGCDRARVAHREVNDVGHSPARVRRGHSGGAKEALAAQTASGKREADRDRVLEALRWWPGSTSAELAEKAGLDRVMVARRLPDLLADALVERWRSTLACEVTQVKCWRWRAKA